MKEAPGYRQHRNIGSRYDALLRFKNTYKSTILVLRLVILRNCSNIVSLLEATFHREIDGEAAVICIESRNIMHLRSLISCNRTGIKTRGRRHHLLLLILLFCLSAHSFSTHLFFASKHGGWIDRARIYDCIVWMIKSTSRLQTIQAPSGQSRQWCGQEQIIPICFAQC